MRCVSTGEASANGHPSEPPKKSRLRRTLLGAGIGALLAMSMVPYVKGHRYASERGYLPIYEIGGRADVNVAQLVLNVSFAALIGALASNLSRRAVARMLWAAGPVAVVLAIWAGFLVFQEQMKAHAESEESTATFEIQNGDFIHAKEHLPKASNYWWWKGWWDGARSARERASDDVGMKKQAAVFRAQKNEECARQLLRNVFVQVDPKKSAEAFLDAPYPSDDKVTEAKRLLLDAAENWHVAGNTAEEERVRAWEKNVKTLPSWAETVPVERSSKYLSTDPNAGVEEAKAASEQQRALQQWESEEEQCREPFPYPPHKWTHVTQFGKTSAIIKFRERKAGDRKKELEGYTKAIGAKFYKEWSRVRQGDADWVEVVFYK
jgi:hypothetical protein